jgi:dihydrofolate reductase
MKLIAIAAVGKNGAIGHAGELPWNIPEDMKFFRDSTREQIVVMGRKTYQSLKKALPKRENAVITRDANFSVSDARIFHALPDAISFFKAREDLAAKTIFVIGGGEIYTLSIPLLDEIWLTEVNAEFNGDAFFPHYSEGKLNLPEFASSSIKLQEDLTSTFQYKFTRYARI